MDRKRRITPYRVFPFEELLELLISVEKLLELLVCVKTSLLVLHVVQTLDSSKCMWCEYGDW